MSTPEAAEEVAARWATRLAVWRVPDARAAAPPPAGFPVQRFADIADLVATLDSPSRRVATAALPKGGTVLDVGCGAGSGSLPLAPPAGRLVGIDVQASMLEAFRERAAARGVAATAVLGPWQEVLPDLVPADVVVSHHLVYGVEDLPGFAHALSGHARRRVVLELSDVHPVSWTAPYWRPILGIDPPEGPTWTDALAVLRAAGIEVQVEREDGPAPLPAESDEDQLRFLRRVLRVGEDRDEELRALLRDHPRPPWRHVTTLWWTTT
ncbi:MAG: class I SAM-dependent methyltransferase [Nitriliruptoraceae bacterium]